VKKFLSRKPQQKHDLHNWENIYTEDQNISGGRQKRQSFNPNCLGVLFVYACSTVIFNLYPLFWFPWIPAVARKTCWFFSSCRRFATILQALFTIPTPLGGKLKRFQCAFTVYEISYPFHSKLRVEGSWRGFVVKNCIKLSSDTLSGQSVLGTQGKHVVVLFSDVPLFSVTCLHPVTSNSFRGEPYIQNWLECGQAEARLYQRQ